MKTKVRLTSGYSDLIRDIKFPEGTIGIVDGYTGTEKDDFAMVIIENLIVTVNVKNIEFVEFFNPA